MAVRLTSSSCEDDKTGPVVLDQLAHCEDEFRRNTSSKPSPRRVRKRIEAGIRERKSSCVPLDYQ